jgi:TRAP-type C4-dicarboxylate transport system permease small subunit
VPIARDNTDAMNSLKKYLDSYVVRPVVSVCRVMIIASMVVLVGMMMLTVSDVFLRYIFKNPVPDSQQITEYLMVCVAFLGMAWVAVKNEHIAVNLIVPRFSQRVQAIFDSVTYFLGLGVLVLISWRTFIESTFVRQFDPGTLLLKIPAYPFYIVLGFGLAMLCLIIFIQLIQHVFKAVKG